MLIFLGAMISGAIIGGMTAYRRKGNKKDIAQYAFGYAMAFTLVAMVVTVILVRTVV